MAHWVKCFSCKHENFPIQPTTSVLKAPEILVLERQKDPLNLLASQSIQSASFKFSETLSHKIENELGRHSMFTSGFHMCTCTHLNLYSIVKVLNITEMGSFEMGIGSSLQDKIGSPPPPPISFALCFPSWN